MGFLSLLLIGVSLSMDAFSVAVCKGLSMKRFDPKYGLILALFFGGFQAIMPIAGYFAGTAFADFIRPVDHWVAFVLLVCIGGKMLWDAFHEEDEEGSDQEAIAGKVDFKELLILAVATSIDALAVGITFALLDVNIWLSALVIGITTFVFSLGGVLVGNRFGAKYDKVATIVGGTVLVLLGVKILLEHLGILVLPF